MKYFEEAKKMWHEYVPRQGQASTIRGELLRSIEKLRDEAQRNGNANWDKGHILMAELLRQHLGGGGLSEKSQNIAKADLNRIMDYGNPYTDDDLYDRLVDVLVEWTRLPENKEPRPHLHNPDLLR